MTYSVHQPTIANKDFYISPGEEMSFHVQIDPFETDDELQVAAQSRYTRSTRYYPASQEGNIAGYVRMDFPSEPLERDGFNYQLQKRPAGSTSWTIVAKGTVWPRPKLLTDVA